MIDYSVYPDVEDLPAELATAESKADYVARVCGAWDFGIVPEIETFRLLNGWREVFDCFPLLHSPAYAAFRTLFGWPAIAGASVLEADYERVDARMGREADPCVRMI